VVGLAVAVASISVAYDSFAATTLLLVVATAAVTADTRLVKAVFLVVSLVIFALQATEAVSAHLVTGFAVLSISARSPAP